MVFIKRLDRVSLLYCRLCLLAVGLYVFVISVSAFPGKKRTELFVSGWRFHLGCLVGDASRYDSMTVHGVCWICLTIGA